MKNFFKKLFKKKEAEVEEITKPATIAEVIFKLNKLTTEYENLTWFLFNEKKEFLDDQTGEFAEKASFALTSLNSNLHFAKEKEMNKLVKDKFKELNNIEEK